ncbi:uncharacterized protein LOC117110338 [Anneissia japonica]|uniref:uncharacterized protein LOC117110338 n=1 Tax=Anneissia japonica TaxID=1529436 RepID=UPI0014256AB1|nr:uncharacterized protein LOC117110338 [Anneissia japonica]
MEEITDDTFRQLLTVFSNWYDQRGLISMLKVLYSDLLKNNYELNKATKVMELMDLLIDSGDLHLTDLSLLCNTINLSKQYGLERKIRDNQLPSFPNVRNVIISKFTPHRQKVMKLGMILIDEEVKKISGLYNKPVKEYADTWSLIMDLERNRIICEEKMVTFIENLNSLELLLAVKVLTEDIPTPKPFLNPGKASDIPKPPSNSGPASDIPNASSNSGHRLGEGVQLSLKRKREDNQPHPEYILDLLKEVNECKDFLTLRHKPKCFAILSSIVSYYKCHGFDLDKTEEGSIVFHLSTHDSNALMNLWEIHSSGKLIKDLAGILVPEIHQQDFLDEWMTYINENEYRAALSRLKGKEKHDELPKLEESKPTLEEMKVPSYEIPVIEIQPLVEISATEEFVQPEFHFQDEKAPISEVSELLIIPEVEECAPYFTKELETKLIAVEGDSAAILQCAVAGIPRPQVTPLL